MSHVEDQHATGVPVKGREPNIPTIPPKNSAE